MTSLLRGTCCCSSAPCTCFPTCPSTAYCESFGFFGDTRCNAPVTDPCCRTYSMTASFSMIPYACCDLDEFVDPLCVTYASPVNAAVYDCNDGSVVSSYTCHVDSYIPVGSGSITCSFLTLNLGGGRCDIDGQFAANVVNGVSTTNTFSCLAGGSGYLSTEFKITVTRACNVIRVVLLYSYSVDVQVAIPPNPCNCVAIGGQSSQYTLTYTKTPGTGSCNIDGTYALTNAACDTEMTQRLMYRADIDCPADCCDTTGIKVNNYALGNTNGLCKPALPALQSFPTTLTVT